MQLRRHPSQRIARVGLLGCLMGTLCLSLSSTVFSKEPTEAKLPLADLQRFTKVVEYIKEYYVKPISDKDIFENAIRGMLSGLDPHSSYFDAEEFADLKANTSGQFGGLGVEVLPEDGYIRVISPIDDSPADRAGVQAGDLIVRINDTPIKGLTPREAIELMRGEKGSKVKLTIVRQSQSKPLIIEVTRDTIHVQSIRGKMLDKRHAYIRIAQFQTNSGDDLINTLQTLKKKMTMYLRVLFWIFVIIWAAWSKVLYKSPTLFWIETSLKNTMDLLSMPKVVCPIRSLKKKHMVAICCRVRLL